jgi:hypothetical protein
MIEKWGRFLAFTADSFLPDRLLILAGKPSVTPLRQVAKRVSPFLRAEELGLNRSGRRN